MRLKPVSNLGAALRACALLIASGPVLAQASADPPWSLTLGLGFRHGPDYIGSRDMRTVAVPLIVASLRTGIGRFSFGDVPTAPGAFFGYTPYETGTLTLGIGVGRDMGRDDDGADNWQMGSAKLRGMGDVDSTPVLGAYGSYRIDRIQISGLLRQAIDKDEGHGGRLADLRVAVELPLPSRWNGELSLGATWADGRYMNAMSASRRSSRPRAASRPTARRAACATSRGRCQPAIGWTITSRCWRVPACRSWRAMRRTARSSRGPPSRRSSAAWPTAGDGAGDGSSARPVAGFQPWR